MAAGIVRRTMAVIGTAAIGALMAPFILGVLSGLATGFGPMFGFVLLLGTVIVPQIFLVNFGLTVAAGAFLRVLRVRHVFLFAVGGMGVAWLSFSLITPAPTRHSGGLDVLPDGAVAGMLCLALAGAIDGILCWWIVGKFTRCAATTPL